MIKYLENETDGLEDEMLAQIEHATKDLDSSSLDGSENQESPEKKKAQKTEDERIQELMGKDNLWHDLWMQAQQISHLTGGKKSAIDVMKELLAEKRAREYIINQQKAEATSQNKTRGEMFDHDQFCEERRRNLFKKVMGVQTETRKAANETKQKSKREELWNKARGFVSL